MTSYFCLYFLGILVSDLIAQDLQTDNLVFKVIYHLGWLTQSLLWELRPLARSYFSERAQLFELYFLTGIQLSTLREKQMACRFPYLAFPGSCNAKTAELPNHEMSLRLNSMNIVLLEGLSGLGSLMQVHQCGYVCFWRPPAVSCRVTAFPLCQMYLRKN